LTAFQKIWSFFERTKIYGYLIDKSDFIANNVFLSNFYKRFVKKFLVRWKIKQIFNSANRMSIEDSLNEFQKYCNQVEEKKRVLFIGNICYSTRIPFLIEINKRNPNADFMLLVENAASKYKIINSFEYKGLKHPLDRKYMNFFICPGLFSKDRFPCYENKKVNRKIRKFVKNTDYLRYAEKNLRKRHYDMGKGYPTWYAYFANKYINELLDIINPEIVVMWNQFHAFHHIFDSICKERKIKTLYFEFGVLPGTYAFDKIGQMGESYPSLFYKKFLELPVSDEELKDAENMLEYLYKSEINRKIQPQSFDLSDKIDSSKPTILLIGQNDYESGLFPYTEHTKKFHSPIFKSSDASAIYISKLAKKNGWNLIYKQHPLINSFELAKDFGPNIIFVKDADINKLIDDSDLVITILSQTGYVSTIRKKPTLMLGYTQLRGKGCTYEAFKKEDIEEVIKIALVNGYTEEQKDSFIKHIAQITKYYLFNDYLFTPQITYGKGIDECASLFEELLNAEVSKHAEN